ncbi:MAG: TetR/AcrR family transcriptional regulator [Candidatus Eremiobacteraeota bacterium]|nr:TetR/AcrR family transcriptional regulator [Candidatus Eremiobacteraeota bacterium]
MITIPLSSKPPEDTRRRILAATREVFAVKGSRGATTREIADRAGVNEATLFRHFGNKHALLDAMRSYYCDASRFKEFMSTLSGNLEKDLYTLALRVLEGIGRNADIIKISLAEEDMDPSAQEVTWRAPRTIHKAIIAYFGEHVRSRELRGDPEMHGRLFMGMMFARVMTRKIWKTQKTDQEVARYCVDAFLNGIRSS